MRWQFTKNRRADSGLKVPALPGCYSQGESVDELMANIREAIGGVLEVMTEQGEHPERNIQILDIAV